MGPLKKTQNPEKHQGYIALPILRFQHLSESDEIAHSSTTLKGQQSMTIVASSKPHTLDLWAPLRLKILKNTKAIALPILRFSIPVRIRRNRTF